MIDDLTKAIEIMGLFMESIFIYEVVSYRLMVIWMQQLMIT